MEVQTAQWTLNNSSKGRLIPLSKTAGVNRVIHIHVKPSLAKYADAFGKVKVYQRYADWDRRETVFNIFSFSVKNVQIDKKAIFIRLHAFLVCEGWVLPALMGFGVCWRFAERGWCLWHLHRKGVTLQTEAHESKNWFVTEVHWNDLTFSMFSWQPHTLNHWFPYSLNPLTFSRQKINNEGELLGLKHFLCELLI